MDNVPVFKLIILILLLSFGKVDLLCEVESGEVIIILDIEESNGNSFNQSTIPAVLPIKGNLSEIKLSILVDTEKIFTLDGKQLKLTRSLDRDVRDISFIQVQLLCTAIASHTQRTVPVTVRVMDINDNVPRFFNLPYHTSVSETVPVGTTVFRGLHAEDNDSSVNSLVEYFIIPGNSSKSDGFPMFSIDLPHQGFVSLRRPLDYERCQDYEIAVIAVDRATKPNKRLSSTATLTIHVLDADDLDPAFDYENCTTVSGICVIPEYSAEVVSGKVSGVLDLMPTSVKAYDRDSLNYAISYSFTGSTLKNFNKFFSINPASAVVRQMKAVDRNMTKEFSIIIKAEEQSEKRRFSTAKLNIIVRPSDDSPPLLKVNSYEGFVDEHSPIGRVVRASNLNGEGIKFTVIDPDLDYGDSKPKYRYELTTNMFKVNSDGFLVVNSSNLDSDPPNVSSYVFQVVVREKGKNAASSPVTITVHVKDINDNNPRMEPLLPLTVLPMVEPSVVAHITAYDVDTGSNGQINYSLRHVSNNGTKKFFINATSGIIKTTGPLEPGQHYSLTLQASDRGGRSSQQILDIDVAPLGRIATSGKPTFTRDSYEVQISEGAAVGTVVLSLLSKDTPDIRDITYSIVDGNSNGAFQLNASMGTLILRQWLDREKIDNYTLKIKAKDSAKHEATTVVNIEVTDINDNNPTFVGEPYVFSVDEGMADVVVGKVKAVDSDAGPNGIVYYSLPMDSVFGVDPVTGEIRTRRALDYESRPIHHVIVTALDGALDPRIATATVTVRLNDAPDEVPVFVQQYYEGAVPENVPSVDLLQVKAVDPDSVKHITYVLKEGPLNLFAVDSLSGIVRVIFPLDFEQSEFFMLTIGTQENYLDRQDSHCIVKINVLDRNDIPPIFTSVPPSLRIPDTIREGTVIATVMAMDSDGTPPNNIVKYAFGANNHNAFDIDHDTGSIKVNVDLSKDRSIEMKLQIKAYDLGTPQLTALTTIPVIIEHTATAPNKVGLGFPETSYTVQIEENSLGNTVVKSIPIIGSSMQLSGDNNFNISTMFTCVVERGNDLEHFYAMMEESSCKLKTKGQQLDYETQPQYQLYVVLKSLQAIIDASRSYAEVTVSVKDVNDNRPVFVYQSPASKLIGHQYVTSLTRDAAALTPFTKVTAIDHDSGNFGQVTYKILSETDPQGYFIVDHDTGLVSNSRTFDNTDYNTSSFKLSIMARDNPKVESGFLNSTTTLTINLVTDEHRLVLVIVDSSPEKVAEQRTKLTEMLQDNSNYVVIVEKIESRKYLNNSKMFVDGGGTDVWFNVIDPQTLKIISVSDSQLSHFFLSLPQQRSLMYSMSTTLKLNVETVRLPLVITEEKPTIPYARMRSTDDVDGFQAALIALACIIAVLGLVGVIYICFIWSRYKTYRDRLQRMSLAPRYEPVLVEPHLKPYETQVLQMTMPTDDDSSSVEESPLSYKGAMDNVSYITKEVADGSTLMGEASFTESDSYDGSESVLISAPQRFTGTMRPANNPVYHSSDENGSSPVESVMTTSQKLPINSLSSKHKILGAAAATTTDL